MKTYKNLYPQIHAFDNLYAAYRAARRGKRNKRQVFRFEWAYEDELLRLQEELATDTYRPGAYTARPTTSSTTHAVLPATGRIQTMATKMWGFALPIRFSLLLILNPDCWILRGAGGSLLTRCCMTRPMTWLLGAACDVPGRL